MDKKINVLLVEDNYGDARLVQLMLEEYYADKLAIYHEFDLRSALFRLEQETINVVLLDLGLPDAQGFLGLLAIHRQYKSMPVVVLTGSEDTQLGFDALNKGAQDYLFKSNLEAHSLYRSIRHSSERTIFEEARRQSEAQFTTAFESAASGMAVLDLEGKFIRVNNALCKLFGHSEAGILNTSLFDFADPEMESRLIEDFQRVFDGSLDRHLAEYFFIGAYDVRLYTLISTSIIRNVDKTPSHIIIHFVDMTERKEAEMQLMQAQKLEAVGQLTGGMAHDFNNLLAVIMGNLEMLEISKSLNELDQKRVKSALNATIRGAELTGRLLAFSRQQPLAPQFTEIGTCVEGMRELITLTLGETVELNIKQDTKTWPVLVDPSQLETTILNLAVNARDAMPHGGQLIIDSINVTLDETEMDDGMVAGDFVMLSVSDSGEGIPEDLQDKVLQPFFTTKDVGKGSGLGLSMVFGFIKQSDGLIKINSFEGEGTSIQLFFPRKMEEVERSNPAMSGDFQAIPSGKGLILVVEDDPNVREIVVGQLNSFGYDTIEAENALVGFEIIQERGMAIDLLFSDITLPKGVSGIELSDEVKKTYPEMPVLLTSGFSEEFIQLKNRSLPPAILRKPYSRDELGKQIHLILN